MSPKPNMNTRSASHVDAARALRPNTETTLNNVKQETILSAEEEEELQHCPAAQCVINNDDDVHSPSSIIYNAHEPFETFRHKVAELVTFVCGMSISEIQTEYMRGGSYNRVVGVTIHPTRPKKYSFEWLKLIMLQKRGKASTEVTKSYVVRIPRQENPSIYEDVAVVESLRTRLALPIPEVMSFDTTCENVIGKPYMILQRLPGQSLARMWPDLNLQQKKSVVRRLAGLVPEITSLKATLRGASLDTSTPFGEAATNQLCRPLWRRGRLQTPLEHLLETCEQWRHYHRKNDVTYNKILNGFVDISKVLHTRGFLNEQCVLIHGDLMAYNLLAEVRSKSHTEITGIIDWDTATKAPEFMAYRAPFWLWTPAHTPTGHIYDEDNANLEPSNHVDKQLKQLFVRCASEKYKLFAFAPEAVLARRMYAMLGKGVYSMRDREEAEDIIQGWKRLHPEDFTNAAEGELD